MITAFNRSGWDLPHFQTGRERGRATICLHGVLILLQLLILRRRYDPVQLLQLPVALVFGYLTDLGSG